MRGQNQLGDTTEHLNSQMGPCLSDMRFMAMLSQAYEAMVLICFACRVVRQSDHGTVGGDGGPHRAAAQGGGGDRAGHGGKCTTL